MVKGAHQERDSDHHIWCTWTEFKTSKRAVIIHDGAAEVAKTLVSFAGGLVGGIAEIFKPSVAAPALSKVAQTTEIVVGVGSGLVSTAPDIYDIQDTVRGGDKKKKKSGKVLALMIAPFPLNGGADTGRSSVSAPELAQIARTVLR